MDIDGATLGPECVLIRRTPSGYRCVSKDEAATLQALAIDRKDDPDWLFRQCHRIVKALSGGNFVLAQIYGLNIPVIELDPGQLQKLASTARAIKANFSPDQPRDDRGRWTDEGHTGAEVPSAVAPRETRPEPTDTLIAPARGGTVPVQLTADNQRENKMVRDIVSS